MAKSRKRKQKNRSGAKPKAPATSGSTSGGTAAQAAASASRTPRKPEAKSSGHTASAKSLDKILAALCGVGVLLTAYLSYVAGAGDHPAYCSDGSSCDLVQSSRWSTLLGVPMAGWGLLTYLALLALTFIKAKKPSRWKLAFFVAICGVGMSTYLTLVSIFQIEATCAYCLASYALITVIAIRLAMTKPEMPAVAGWKQVIGTPVISAFVIVAALQMHFSGLFDAAAGPEEPRIRDLALHLKEVEARFYGAYWCPRCQDQKDLFGASVDRLPYVECSPSGRNGPQSASCAIKNIQDYPTWIINGQRYVGVQSLNALEQYSGFKPPS